MSLSLSYQRLELPLRVRLKQASKEHLRTSSVWVEARDDAGLCGLGEGCPRPYQTGEDLDGALRWLESRRRDFAELDSLETLREFVVRERSEIDRNPAAWAALELALLDLLAQRSQRSVEQLLGVSGQRHRFHYAAVISDERGERLRSLISRFASAGFTDFKLKLSGELDADIDKLEALRELVPSPELRVRLDANNLWGTELGAALEHLRQLPGPIHALEEPLKAGEYAGMAELARTLELPIMLDESLLTPRAIEAASAHGEAWIANIKVSRVGGLLRALELIEALTAVGWPILIGAQAGESSVLTRAGIVAARASGAALWGQEGAAGTWLIEHDPVAPELRFGPRGLLALDALELGEHGWGLSATAQPPSGTNL